MLVPRLLESLQFRSILFRLLGGGGGDDGLLLSGRQDLTGIYGVSEHFLAVSGPVEACGTWADWHRGL